MKTSKNKIVIFDCQLLQTKAWHRGMGKYTAQMISAFLKNKKYVGGYEKTILLFNSDLVYSDELKKYVEDQRNVEAVFLSLHVPEEGSQHSITVNQKKNKKILDEYIEKDFAGKDVGFLITSLFLDEACPVFPSKTYNSLIYYDLIPLMYYRLYLGLGASEQYFTRFSILLDADKVFAISETVANDLVAFLGVPKEKVINIRGASNYTVKREASKPQIDITKPYILMPTGGDPRKNNLNGVKGFSAFNERNGNRYQLLITSFFSDGQKEELGQYSDDIVFTGNVSDTELWWLYENAETVLFPAEYEGLGMPILEAVDADKVIVCSNIAVFREISEQAFFMFDPREPESISSALEEVFNATSKEVAVKKKFYPKIKSYYTWDSTAGIVNEGLIGKIVPKSIKKPRIAFVTPNVCQSTEEARYIALQYSYLRDIYDVDFYYDLSSSSLPVRPSHLSFSTNTRRIEDLTKDQYETYDLVIYVISNSKASVATLQAALALPGLVIVTDKDLDYVFTSARKMGAMSERRYIAEENDHLSSLMNTSRAVATTVPMKKDGFAQLSVVAHDLAYPPLNNRSLYNRIFVSIDARCRDAEWNIDLIKDIASVVDKSRVNFTVVARTHFPEIINRILDLPAVTLYENVSDHEYLTLLGESDLYVDARPGEALSKLFPAFEAHKNSLDVFLGPVGDIRGQCARGLHIAESGATLRDNIFRWLIQDTLSDNQRNKADLSITSQPTDLVELIEKTMQDIKE